MLVTTTLRTNADSWEEDNASMLPFVLIRVVVHLATTTNTTTFITIVTQVYAVLPPVDSTAIILANTLEDALWLRPL